MAAAIGLERSYLSQLESGKKPIQEWVLNRAKAVKIEAVRAAGGRLIDRSKVNMPMDPTDFTSYTPDDLIKLNEYFASLRSVAPTIADGLLQHILRRIQHELSRRMNPGKISITYTGL